MANLQGRALAKHNLRNFSPGAREMIRVRLLGGFSLSVGPRTIEESAWRLRKAAGLVKLLALTPGHRIHRDQIDAPALARAEYQGGGQQPTAHPSCRPPDLGTCCFGHRFPLLLALRRRPACAMLERDALGRR